MRKFTAFILLLCHMNTSMFLPQVAEDDVYDSSGAQVDDVNSVVEYIAVALGYDKTADDEDDDSGQNFHLVKFCDYDFKQIAVVVENKVFVNIRRHAFAEYKMPIITSPTTDILTPPPDQFS